MSVSHEDIPGEFFEQVLSRLSGVKRNGSGASAKCPCHDDNHPSLSVTPGENGKVLLHCHAGCDYRDIAAKLGINQSVGGQSSNTYYVYRDESNQPIRRKVRKPPKDFYIQQPDGDGWKSGKGNGKPVLYRLPELRAGIAAGRTVFVCEGEKDADRLASLGLVATTNIEGAAKPGQTSKWRPEYSEQLKGANRVVLLADNDEPGRAHMETVAKSLAGKVADIRLLELPDLPSKGDVSDWLNKGGTADQLKQLAAIAPEAGGAIGAIGAPPPFTGVSAAQLSAARLAPKCFVENYLFADVALLAAAGGTGKTTMALYEAVCLALGWPIWGNRVIHTGKTLFITAEDSAEQFHARLREIMAAMELTESAKRHVMDGIMVWDITGQTRRLAELGDNQNIVVTDLADQIIEVYRDAGLAQVVIDPLVSFGPGERFINDGNQAVIVAARRIVRGLGCCVRLVHHVDQGSARGGALDQYAARGGTALPDGCRMVAILGSVKDEAGLSRCPPECEPGPNDSVFILARPKLSYAPPQPQIWIVRRGYSFQHFVAVKRSPGEEMEADATKVEAFLCTELEAGRRYTVRQMEDTRATNLPRKRLRAAIGLLETTGRIRHEQLDKEKQRGARKEYLHPTSYCATPPGAIDEKSAPEPNQSEPIAPATSIAPPLRENINGAIDAVSISPVSPIAPLNDGAIAAQWRNSHETAISDDEMEVF